MVFFMSSHFILFFSCEMALATFDIKKHVIMDFFMFSHTVSVLCFEQTFPTFKTLLYFRNNNIMIREMDLKFTSTCALKSTLVALLLTFRFMII